MTSWELNCICSASVIAGEICSGQLQCMLYLLLTCFRPLQRSCILQPAFGALLQNFEYPPSSAIDWLLTPPACKLLALSGACVCVSVCVCVCVQTDRLRIQREQPVAWLQIVMNLVLGPLREMQVFVETLRANQTIKNPRSGRQEN